MTPLLLLACTENTLIPKEDPHEPIDSGLALPALEVDPEAVDFGEVFAGQAGGAVITLTNVGQAELILDEIALDDPSLPLTLTSPGPHTLAPGDASELLVAWLPQDHAGLSTALGLRSNDPARPDVAVPLLGRTPAPAIHVEPASLDFGLVEVGQTAQAEALIVNVGEAPLWLDGAAFALGNPEFAVGDPGWGSWLDPGQSTPLPLTYGPVDEGPDEDTLLIRSSDPAAPEVALSVMGAGEDRTLIYEIEVWMTADDAWRGWMDGVPFTAPGQSAWSSFDRVTFTLESGDHTLAIHATDTGQVIAGVLAVVYVDGVKQWTTGGSDWLLTPTNPGTGWQDVSFNTSAWVTPSRCADGSPWGSVPSALYNEGAAWVWGNTNCRVLGEIWLRLDMSLP